jgi:bifunctional non-homologous end joining protein LigD
MKSTTLYYREGNSDKVYQASIEPKGSAFVVNFAFGRRGTTLNTGTKTQQPVDLQSAEKVFDKLVREKKAKGYTEGPNGTPYTSSAESKEYSGILPQLLNPIEEKEIETYITSSDWAMQEKFDGKRLLLLKQGNVVRGINRKGLCVGLPETVMKEAQRIDGDFLIDGEAVGEIYYAFDLLSRHGEDIRNLSYCWRLDNLVQTTEKLGVCSFRRIINCVTENDKREHLELLSKVGAEGVVFKNLNATYTSGRPNSGGPQLKCKFYATASFIVGAVNKQRSVLLTLINAGKQVPAGNVTIPANHKIPAVGEVVEIRYLYAFKESGSVYQPIYLGKREDLSKEECTVNQLKFKSNQEEEEDADQ